MRTLVSWIDFRIKGGQTRLDLLVMPGDIGVDAVDAAEHGREVDLVMVGELPVERSAQLILLLYLDKRGRPKVRIHGRPRSDRKRSSANTVPSPGV